MKKILGIDMLRIISMFMVVILHVLGTGGVLEHTQPFSLNYEAMWFLEIACYCAVNCYALISGYVMCHSKMRYHKIIVLWLQVALYSIGITLLFYMFDPSVTGIKDMLKSFIPVTSHQYWYFTAYFGMFFFIPVLNHVIQTMKKRDLEKVLISSILLFSVLPICSLNIFDPFKIGNGYSMLWLMELYLIGGYLKTYEVISQYKKKTLINTYFICIVITWLSKLILEFITLKVFGEIKAGNILISYTSPTILLSSISLFLFFVKLDIRNKHVIKFIQFFAPISFVFNNIICQLFSSYALYFLCMLIIIVLFSVLVIFIICSLIDALRLRLFNVLKINDICFQYIYKLKTYI